MFGRFLLLGVSLLTVKQIQFFLSIIDSVYTLLLNYLISTLRHYVPYRIICNTINLIMEVF